MEWHGMAWHGRPAFPTYTCPPHPSTCTVINGRQADGKLPVAERRGYKHVGDALLRVAREEGVLTYWRCVDRPPPTNGCVYVPRGASCPSLSLSLLCDKQTGARARP